MRHEFSARTKKAAYLAAGGVCMAAGTLYGLPPGIRCTVILVPGNHEFDHYPLPAHAEGSDAVENCMPLCKTCHSYKTRNFDIPTEAKIKRVQRKHGRRPDTRKSKPKPIQNRGFEKPKMKKPWAKRPMQRGTR